MAVAAGQGILCIRPGILGGNRPHLVADPQGNGSNTPLVFPVGVGMALFLFAVDSTLAWLVQLLTGRVE